MIEPLTISAGWGGNVVGAFIVPGMTIRWGFNEFVNWLVHCRVVAAKATVAAYPTAEASS
jgi:hypothetical protein